MQFYLILRGTKTNLVLNRWGTYVYYSAIAYFLQSPESYMTVTTHIKAYIM